MKTFEELKKIHELHEAYQKHDENKLLCSCGKDTGTASLQLFIKFLDELSIEDARKFIIYYDSKESFEFEKELWLAALFFKTGNVEDLNLLQKENLTKGAIHKILLQDQTKINMLYKRYPNLVNKVDVFDAWEYFDDKLEFAKKYNFNGDLNGLVKTDPSIIKKVNLNKSKILYLTLTKELLDKYTSNIYQVVSKSKNISLLLPDETLIETLVKNKRLYLLYMLLEESAVNLFVEYHHKLPIEMIDELEFRLDKKLAKLVKLSKIDSSNSLLIAYNKKVYKLEINKEDL